MSEVQFKQEAEQENVFFIEENGERVAFMVVDIHGARLTALHTEVLPAWREHKLGVALVDAMANYARSHHLKVTPLCPYTRSMFVRYPEKYADLWERETGSNG